MGLYFLKKEHLSLKSIQAATDSDDGNNAIESR
jgi:hypothetical protein